MQNLQLLVAAWLAFCASNEALAEINQAKPDLAKAQQTVTTICAACKDGVRSNPVMAGMAANLSPEDMRALGLYFSQQKPKGMAAKDPALVTQGQRLYRGGNSATGVPACAACHAPTGIGIPVRYPRLSGQHADYTVAQLKAFKAGERGMDKEGKDSNGRVMVQVASKMSDQEMRAVAEYIAGLH